MRVAYLLYHDTECWPKPGGSALFEQGSTAQNKKWESSSSPGSLPLFAEVGPRFAPLGFFLRLLNPRQSRAQCRSMLLLPIVRDHRWLPVA
jgi:hypothetical protein